MIRRKLAADDGAFAVLYAVLVVLLVGIVALVVDLGELRMDRRANRAATDSGAIAGASKLGLATPDPAAACHAAIGYVEADLGLTHTSDTCDTTWAKPYSCSSPVGTATEVVGSRRIEITWPVPDDNALMIPDTERWSPAPTQPAGTADGKPCHRLGVAIAQDRTLLFSGVWQDIGHFKTTDSHSVAMAEFGDDSGKEPAPLVVLDPHSCNALTVGGGGGVTVNASADGKNPGFIQIDSDGTGGEDSCSPQTVISAPSSVNHLWAVDGTTAKAAILMYAMADPSTVGVAFDPSDVSNCGTGTSASLALLTASGAHICPVPIPNAPVGVGPWQGRYNCGGLEPESAAASTPPSSTPAEGCYNPDPSNPLPTPRDYVDQWVRYAQGGVPSTFPNQIVDAVRSPTNPVDRCWVRAAESITVVGDAYVRCSSLHVDGRIAFTGQVVMQGDLNVTGGCVLFNTSDFSECTTLKRITAISPAARDGGSVYIGGNLSLNNNSGLIDRQSFMYLGGRLDASTGTSSTGVINWIAPYGADASPQDPCQPATSAASPPTPGCFEALGLWTRGYWPSTKPDILIGGASLNVDGTLFLPYAYFKFGGGVGDFQDRAQFVTRRLEVRGSADLVMVPNAKRSTSIPLTIGALIR